MQPLSSFRDPRLSGHCEFGQADTMTSRPQVAIRVAECISEWADIETILGLLLAVLLDANAKAALAMYGATENRATQIRMLMAAAGHKVPQDESDLLAAILRAHVTPTSKDRDKLAHWCWGYSPDFPQALLLTAPTTKTALHHYALDAPSKPQIDSRLIFLVKETDLARMATRFRNTRERLIMITSMIREKNLETRAAIFQQLSNEPLIAAALTRIRADRQNSQATQPLCPQSEPSAKA